MLITNLKDEIAKFKFLDLFFFIFKSRDFTPPPFRKKKMTAKSKFESLSITSNESIPAGGKARISQGVTTNRSSRLAKHVARPPRAHGGGLGVQPPAVSRGGAPVAPGKCLHILCS